jgi:hypothetical protein
VSTIEAAATIRSAISVLPRDSLRFFGEWFGGRRDNAHRLTGVTAADDVLRLSFNNGETLTVWSPTGVTATPAAFQIQDAARLRWEWFSYGRPQAPENLHQMEYIRSSAGRITVTDTSADSAHEPDEAAPAVEMIAD